MTGSFALPSALVTFYVAAILAVAFFAAAGMASFAAVRVFADMRVFRGPVCHCFDYQSSRL